MAAGPAQSGLDQFVTILTLPDNIPIAGMLFLILFFTWLGFREARKNDELIEKDRREEILRKMQE